MHPSEHPDYPEHFQPTALKVEMTPKAARDIQDFLEKQESVMAHGDGSFDQWPTREQEQEAENRLEGANFVLKALGVTRNFVKWTAEIE